MTPGYHTVGHGPIKIIFLHGWLSDHQVYKPLFPMIDEDKYTAVFADYRGYGLSKTKTGDFTIAEIAEDVIDLTSSLGWDNCIIAGHSMGGMVLQKVACLKPQLVTAGIAITPVPASGLPLDNDTAAFFRSAADDATAMAGLFNALTGERYVQTFLDLMARETFKATTKDALLGYMDAWTGTDFSKEVKNLKTQIFVIAGAHDGAVGPDVMKQTYLEQLENVELEIISGAGHYPAQETPVELYTMLEKHFSAYPA